MSQVRFMSTEMTPRAWRMLSYCFAGFLLYSMISLLELVQRVHLNRIDAQLQAVSRLEAGNSGV